MANIREVAQKAGVSPSTVSRVLNGNAPVNEQTRTLVLEAVRELEYDADKKRKSRAFHVAIILPKRSANNLTAHPAFYTAISSFLEVLRSKNVDNTLLLLDGDHIERDIVDFFSNPLDGYFILGTSEEEENALIPYLKNKNIAYIILNRWVSEKYMNYVNVDDVNVAHNAVEWLIQNGHQKIAFVGGNANFRNSKLRIHGYTMAMEENALPIPPEYILQGVYSEEYGYSIADVVWNSPQRPTAALCSSDTIAIGLMRRLEELGAKLPDDFSIIGWGNFTVASRYVRPALTSVGVPNAEMGRQAAEALLNLLNNPSVARIQILMDAPLIIRDSCKPLLPSQAMRAATADR